MRPYEGNESYIFVSYAHKNAPRVQPIMQAMIHHGFRLWYDSGIEAGTEWPEFIADHLSRCEAVVVFMTDDVVASKNCRNEINFALNLDKPILVVYMDPVTLTQGLSLQLNSTQSMYKYLQPSDEIFLQELFRARILRNCAGNIAVDNQPEAKAQPRSNTIISNVCSLGTNDSTNPFPEGKYSTVINRDAYQTIRFHSKLSHVIGKECTVKVRTKIYNSDNLLVLDDEVDVACKSNYDRFSTSWIIRGDDGSFVPTGNYYAEISINYSPVFIYRFSIIAPSEGVHSVKDLQDKQDNNIMNAIDSSLEKRRNKCFQQLSRKKGALWFLAYGLLMVAFVITLTNTVPFGAIACIILSVIPWVGLLKYTKEHVVKKTFVAVLLITLLLPFYGIFLLISGIINLSREKELKAELAQLSSFRG